MPFVHRPGPWKSNPPFELSGVNPLHPPCFLDGFREMEYPIDLGTWQLFHIIKWLVDSWESRRPKWDLDVPRKHSKDLQSNVTCWTTRKQVKKNTIYLSMILNAFVFFHG